MELRQLEYFQAASRLNNITRAADQLHVSQPSVTIGIQSLEEELGVKLLNRSQKRISLTPEGQIFLRHVEDILTRVSDSIAEMNDHRLLQKGTIRIGITPMMGAVLFPSAFAHFQKNFPNVNIAVVEEGSLSVAAQLEKGELDIGIMITSDMPSDLKSQQISRGQILVCLPPGHPLGEYERIPFDKLRDQPFILFGEDTYSRQIILKECDKFHFVPRIAFSSSQIGTVIGLVSQGAGITFFIEDIARNQDSVMVRPLAEPLVLIVGLAWNGKRYLSKAAKAFIDSFCPAQSS